MEKPVRRKASFVRYDVEGRRIKGHKGAQSSGSGAGAWLAKGRQATELPKIINNENPPSTSSNGGRRYHIPASIAANPVSPTDVQKIMLSNRKDIQTSESGDVDLDLSFDYVSKMEKEQKLNRNESHNRGRISQPSSPRKQQQFEKENNQANTTPRGMSKTDWGARQRKKPPTPLSLEKNRGDTLDLTSQLSPESPTMRLHYDDEPLTIVPISATRRATDAGIVTPLDSYDHNDAISNLIQQQRFAASKRQNGQQEEKGIHASSPSKRIEHSSPKKRNSNRINKTPFGENMKANNAQLVRASEEVDLFYDERSDEVNDINQFHNPLTDKRFSKDTNSELHESNSNNKLLRSRRPSAIESVESSNHSMPVSYKTARSKPSVGGHGGSSTGHSQEQSGYLPSPSAENVLGIFYPAKHVPVLPQVQNSIPESEVEETVDDKNDKAKSDSDSSSPMFTQKSTPITPYTPLFSDNDNSDQHATSSISSTGGRTPLTAVSTLFGDRLDIDGKQKGSVEMVRGATTPNPISSIAAQVIREESTLSLDRPPSLPPSESRKIIATEDSQISIDTDESIPQGERRKSMIVTTTISPDRKQNSFDLTDVTGTRAQKGPWQQSPLLLDVVEPMNKKRSNTLSGAIEGVGLGLLLGNEEGKLEGNHAFTERMINDIEINRAEVYQTNRDENHLGLDLNPKGKKTETIPLAPQILEGKTLSKSQSRTSTIEGFAINVTQPEHRVDVPTNVVDIDEIIAAGNMGGRDSKHRWSSKLWSMTNAFRSPARSTFEDNTPAQSPPMRSLTLVGKHGKEIDRGNSIVKRSSSRENLKAIENVKRAEGSPLVDAYHSMPSSSVIPGNETFANEGIARPTAARYSEARSSKHVKRMSRIQYVKAGEEEDHVQVNMDSIEIKTNTPLDRALLDMIKSPRVADTPSGTTPHLGTFTSTNENKTNRLSWTVNKFTSNSPSMSNNNSVWLMPKRQSLTGARDSELYALADKMRNILNDAGGEGHHDDVDSAAVEAMLTASESKEDGLRRRNNHRSINSVPNTPTFMVEGWDTEERSNQNNIDEQGKRISYHTSKYDVKGVSVAFQEPDVSYDAQWADGRQSRLNMYARPRSGMNIFHNWGNSGHANDGNPYREYNEKDNRISINNNAGPQPPHKHMSDVYTNRQNEKDGLYSYSSEALQRSKPSQTLFFAGFLLMPWLWFVGGWILEDDGTLFIQHEKVYSRFFDSNRVREDRDDDSFALPHNNMDDPYASGRKSRAGWYTEEPRTPSTIANGSTGSIILHDGEQQSRQNRFSTMMTNRMSRINFKGGLGGFKKRRQAKEEELNQLEEESKTVQMARQMFNWDKLDRYVILNRIMAILAAIIVFTGFGLAIAAVVINF